MTTNDWLLLRYIGAVFGKTAIELAGRVVHPDYQAQGIGTQLLREYVDHTHASLLTTYTRNPSVLRMLADVAGQQSVYPLTHDDTLRQAALAMPYASVDSGGNIYHINRYGENGLFGEGDPADRAVHGSSMPLKQQFPGLAHIGNALVAAARIEETL